MSEPYWAALGGGSVDYKGAWAAGTAYAPGDVVRYAGVDFIAVNPSMGVNPGTATGIVIPTVPLVTALPGSPVDGDEVILTDSLTAGTYQWRFRYVAARATNKWVYIGGGAAVNTREGAGTTSSTSYTDLSDGSGPSLMYPVAGDYIVGWGAAMAAQGSASVQYMGYAFGSTVADDGHVCRQDATVTASVGRFERRALTPGAVAVVVKHRASSNSQACSSRWLSLEPIAVGG